MEKGKTLFARGQFAEASLNYRKATQTDPNSGEAFYRLGLSELKQNKTYDAYLALSQAVTVAPDHRAARTELTDLALNSYLADTRHPKALYDLLIKLSTAWLAKDPGSLDGLRIKGYLAIQERRPEEAVDMFRRALQSNPKQQKITLGLMDALYRTNQSAEAETTGLHFVAGDKTAGDVYDALYRLYLSGNKPEDAEKILIRKVKDNPRKGEYMLQLAGHYARAGKKPEMYATLQNFLANPDADAKVHRDAGDFYVAIADWPKAIEQYKAGAATNPKDALTCQNRIARALISQDQKPEALKVLSTALAQNPDDKEARTLRAALLIGKPGGEGSKGLREFQTLVEQNPDDSFLQFVLTRAQLESGDFAGANVQLTKLIQKNPQFMEARLSLAEIAYKQDQMKQALQHAGVALERDPNNYRAQLIEGSALLRLGNLDEASTALGRLSRQAPQSVDVRLQLAMLDLKRRKFAEAEAAFRKIEESSPNEMRAVAGLVDVDLAQNHIDKALDRLEQELRRTHRAPQIRTIMAMTALRGGRYNVAIENLRKLSMETPNSIDADLKLADVFRLKGDYRGAIETVQKAALRQPKDSRPAAILTFLLDVENRKQEAKMQARRALALSPTDPGAMNNLAYLLAETGDSLDEALKLARKAVNSAPGHPYFADTLGFVYLKRDQNDEAMEILNNLVRKYPRDAGFAYHMGMAWYQKGDREKAKVELTRALEKNPTKAIETDINELLAHLN